MRSTEATHTQKYNFNYVHGHAELGIVMCFISTANMLDNSEVSPNLKCFLDDCSS